MAENEIYDGNAETEKEKKFWARQQLLENVSLVQFAAEVKELGGDPAKILELHAVLLREKK